MRTLASELGPHVEKLTSRPRIYADANVPAGAVRHMRRRLRWDVLAVIEDQTMRRASDVHHYRTASMLRRTLISLDDDFPRRSAVSTRRQRRGHHSFGAG